jgi:hypothetical protein
MRPYTKHGQEDIRGDAAAFILQNAKLQTKVEQQDAINSQALCHSQWQKEGKFDLCG